MSAVGVGAGIIFGRPAAAAGGGPPPFTPATLTGLQLWGDASVAASIFQDSAGTTPAAADAAPVGRMSDLSGLGNHLVQPTPAQRPSIRLAVQNGKPVIRFQTVLNSFLNVQAPLLTMPQPYTIWLVASNPDGSSTYYCDSAGTDNGKLIARGSTDTTLLLYQDTLVFRAVTSLSVVNCILVTYDGPAGILNFNGAEQSSFAGLTTGPGFRLACSGATGSGASNMDLCEVALYGRALTIAERGQLQAYGKAKWATP